MQQLTHYKLNTGKTVESKRSSQEIIDRLRALAAAGGIIPGRHPFRVKVDHGLGSALFSIWWGEHPVVTCGVAWTVAGANTVWPFLEKHYREVSDLLIPALVDRDLASMVTAAAEQPASLPWLGAVSYPLKITRRPPDISWLSEFECAMAWTILARDPNAKLSEKARRKLWDEAHCAGAAGKLDEAAWIFQHLAAQRPDDSEYALGLGRSLRELGQNEQALEALLRAEKLNPADQLTQHEIGAVFAATGRWAEAEERFRKVLSMPPDGQMCIRQYAQASLEACLSMLQHNPGAEGAE